MNALIRFTERGSFFSNKYVIDYFSKKIYEQNNNYFYNSNTINKIEKDYILYFSFKSKIVAVAQFTSNYFMIKYFDIRKKEKDELELKFISLYKENDEVKSETATDIYELENNPIIDEMENVYLANSKLFHKE